MLTSKILGPGDDLVDAYKIRQTVFVEEQKFDPELEFDDVDGHARHVVLYDKGRPVATGRAFRDDEGSYHIGRVAVLQESRGGTGRALMDRLEALAHSMGARFISLSAQCRVQGFYEKLGYAAKGSAYLEEECPHVRMEKML